MDNQKVALKNKIIEGLQKILKGLKLQKSIYEPHKSSHKVLKLYSGFRQHYKLFSRNEHHKWLERIRGPQSSRKNSGTSVRSTKNPLGKIMI